jgi:CheY-like chemotaxis protein
VCRKPTIQLEHTAALEFEVSLWYFLERIALGGLAFGAIYVKVRLTRKLADRINGVDVTGRAVGEVLQLSRRDAEILMAEGWATPHDGEHLEVDARQLEELSVTARRLAQRAVAHEQRVIELAKLSIPATNAYGAALAAVVDSPEACAGANVLSAQSIAITTQLCTDAREQRELAETLVRKLTPDDATALPPHTSPLVLVVDGSPLVRGVLTKAFADAGVAAVAARDGLDALIAAHKRRPIAAVMDINMPVLDGVEAARLLRARRETRHITIVAHTANPDALDGPVAALFARVLPKSTAPAAIVATVLEMIVRA